MELIEESLVIRETASGLQKLTGSLVIFPMEISSFLLMTVLGQLSFSNPIFVMKFEFGDIKNL